jgi:hypothetical protein
MIKFTYADKDHTVVNYIDEKGIFYSKIVEALVVPDGTVIEPYVAPPPPIPSSVTRFQALATLAAGGYLDTAHTYIDALPRSNVQRLAFENATDWERTSPTLNALATMLNLTSTEVDDLFIAASSISA